MRLLGLKISKYFGTIIVVSLLGGCSTVGGWLGADDAPEMAAEPMAEAAETPDEQSAAELLAQKDQALIDQGMRIAAAERQLQIIQEENSALKLELETAQAQAREAQNMLDQANESQVAAAAENAAPSAPRVTAPDGGYGLHLASYELRESIEPGIAAIRRQIPVLIDGKPVKIAQATVRGRNFNRLIIGQFDSQSDAQAECRQALLLVSFCEVIAFEGEDF